MAQTSQAQQIQEGEYVFPYHYLPRYEAGLFSNARILSWGHEYLAYLTYTLETVQRLGFRALLDVGCGDGRFLFEARRAFPDRRLAGVDFSQQAVRYARAFNPDLDVWCANIAQDSLDARFDLITLIETLEHIPLAELEAFVRGLHAHCTPGGRLIVTVPSANIPVSAKHVQHFTPESLAATLAPCFTLQTVAHINRESRLANAARRLLVNRYFLVLEPHLLAWAFRAYLQRYLKAQPHNARRLCAVFTWAAP